MQHNAGSFSQCTEAGEGAGRHTNIRRTCMLKTAKCRLKKSKVIYINGDIYHVRGLEDPA